ncbi:molybdenum cofactor biosynthesis protein B [Gordonia sp. (in: high G+C Gram-positive bacteria)]|uniref:MogA/MoaB family molybdenum cofactor biosynthesis protein n=1 Tax=Gordonia sp. (in: high G+C Gram-positive bacteria) TaxID=84139 RepID=UPI0035298BB5
MIDAPGIDEIEADAAALADDGIPAEALLRALVVVVDDEGDAGRLGPLMCELLEEGEYHVDATVTVSEDEVEIRNALNTAVIGGVDLVVSVGGVGVRARDVTPEATEPLLDRRLRGIEEALRASGLSAGATDGGLSRGMAGISGQTLVVNLANSRAAVRDGMATLIPLSHYIIDQISEF